MNHEDSHINETEEVYEMDCTRCKAFWWMPRYCGHEIDFGGVVYCPSCGAEYRDFVMEDD